MMLQEGKPYISAIAENHGELAKQRDDDVDSGKDGKSFWYWLGYYDGQDSILNKEHCETQTQDGKS